MNLLGNIIWLIFGGFFTFVGYMFGGLMLCLTIIGIPFGLQLFKIGILTLMPFGTQVREIQGASGCIAAVLNIIWIFCGGIWIALGHLFFGLLLTITIIGIPFARQHFKLLTLTFTPFGKELYSA
ncbi:YccF domain-containing protein [Chitinophaga sp. GCM10012297]|uniref:YccF domain-containing protein n=1 Tax=Chitinophaga chungangae TaxID=2821488 RepID=A0ABS3YKK1_9BACT|nr:YccF domain-containing protein [Chitinophaga chungangae]MBO9155221.1 YccF domain-containing protein [Chitinophaga chungangae]